MKLHFRSEIISAFVAGSLFSPAFATVSINYVTVGDTGNAPDASGYGAVSHEYKIGKYEVTNAQYVEFLNAKGSANAFGIYSSSMASYGITQIGSSGSFTYSVTSGFENKPVVFVSWFDSVRFANWLGNGQGGNDMETGAYTLNGATSGIIAVNSGATVYIPSEDEWYKATYYNGDTSTYSLYPNGQNSITTADANYLGNGINASVDVGSYSSDPSFYGTFDQGGNAWEWNDAVISGTARGLRGGSWIDPELNLRSPIRNNNDPSNSLHYGGFRVASIPEPSAVLFAVLVNGFALIRRKR